MEDRFENEFLNSLVIDENVDFLKRLHDKKFLSPGDIYYMVMYCVTFGKLEMLKFFTEFNVDLSFGGNFCIRLASLKGYTDIVEYLLTFEIVNPSANYDEAIKLASQKGHLDIVKILLTDYRVDPNKAFSEAVYNKQVEMAEVLMSDYRFQYPDDSDQLLLYSAAYNMYSIVETLLKNPSINTSTISFHTLLNVVNKDYMDLLELFLKDPRIDPNSKEAEAFLTAITKRNIGAVKLFLNTKRLRDKYIRFGLKRSFYNMEIFKLLVSTGVDFSMFYEDFYETAQRKNYVEMIEFLEFTKINNLQKSTIYETIERMNKYIRGSCFTVDEPISRHFKLRITYNVGDGYPTYEQDREKYLFREFENLSPEEMLKDEKFMKIYTFDEDDENYTPIKIEKIEVNFAKWNESISDPKWYPLLNQCP